jgi:hypothetical protein
VKTSSGSRQHNSGEWRGFSTLAEVKDFWKYSRASFGDDLRGKSASFQDILKPKKKQRWARIASTNPFKFFKRYLQQFPGDTCSDKPVVMFSTRPFTDLDDAEEKCGILDVALIPDNPGVCFSITQTPHDQAPYHMLSSKTVPGRGTAGTLTSNSMATRKLPSEQAYRPTRSLLSDYFEHLSLVQNAVHRIPANNESESTVRRKQWIGCVVEEEEEAELFHNAVRSAVDLGVNAKKFWAFTTSKSVYASLDQVQINGATKVLNVIYLPELEKVGRREGYAVDTKLRRYFLQVWFAFAVCDRGARMIWQSPGTYWLARPDRVVDLAPRTETIWAYKGRWDINSGPFFPSFDLAVLSTELRTRHLVHEILTHFELVFAWDSLDSVVSYRLAENNARYGCSFWLWEPHKVLHSVIMAPEMLQRIAEPKEHSAQWEAWVSRLRSELKNSADPPSVMVIPHEGLTPRQAKLLLQDIGLWNIGN